MKPAWRDCPNLEDLSGLLDGECTPREADRLHEHIGVCAGCQGTLSALKASDLLLRRADPAKDQDVDVDGLLASLNEALEASGDLGVSRPRPGARLVRIVAGVASVAAAVLLIAVLVRGRRIGEPPSSDPPIDMREGIADPVAQAGSASGLAPAVLASSGYRTLVAMVDESWPARCREMTEEALVKGIEAFREGGDPVPEIHSELRECGGYAAPVLRRHLEGEDEDLSRLTFEIMLLSRDDSLIEDLMLGAARHGRMDDTLTALDEMASRRSVPHLRDVVSSGTAREGARAIEILGKVSGQEPLMALVEIVRQGGDLAPAAVASIAARDDRRAAAALLDLDAETDGDPVVRMAMRSIGPRVAPFVRRRLRSGDDAECREAVRLVGELRDRQSVPVLRALLRKGRMRDAVLRSLLQIGESVSIPDMLACLELQGDRFTDPDALRVAVRSLDTAGLKELERLACRKKGDSGRKAVTMLAAAGDVAAPHLARTLRSGNHTPIVVDALARIDDPEARSALQGGLRDPRHGERVLAGLLESGRGEVARSLLRSLLEEQRYYPARRMLARLERERSDGSNDGLH